MWMMLSRRSVTCSLNNDHSHIGNANLAIEIVVPRLGWSMDEGTFAEWLKQDGDSVAVGDMLFVLESEKAAQEVESFDSGILRIPPGAPEPGDLVAVGQLLGFLCEPGESIPAVVDSTSGAMTPDAPGGSGGAVVQPDGRQSDSAAQPSHDSDQSAAPITPRARRLAREAGVDWSGVAGTGKAGRIRERDIRALLDSAPSADSDTLERGSLQSLGSVRRTIAERMLAGVQQAAPVTLTSKADATNLVNLRQQFKAAASNEDCPGYHDLIIKLVARPLIDHPLLRTQWRTDGLWLPEAIDIGLATETDHGLMVPVIRDVPAKSLQQVAQSSRELVTLARDRRLTAEQMRGGVFTVTSLGRFGVDAFTPIINLPQTAILGVGRIAREPAVVGDAVLPRDTLTLSLTFDHRVVDGAEAARFLDAIRGCVEQPAPWLIAV
jgi:pyruvate dehydrogenase E2 component (dihydrolipoamide acetyltransferase)